jgi:hypothetical protein
MSVVKEWVGPVYLEPIEHKYHHKETGDIFTSVTKVLSSVEPHFDTDAVASAIVKQRDDVKQEKYIGMSKEQILDNWQELNDTANEYGTKVHEAVEKYLLSQKWYKTTDELEIAVIKAYNELKIDEGTTMWPERIMFSAEHKLAGTADLIIDIDDTYFDVGDYKTNKEFNYFNKFGNKTLKKPFDHLQDCQYSIYSLQLSIYAYMYILENPHKICRQIYILFWDKQKLTFEKIPVMFLKTEAKRLLEMHKLNLLS